jgi:hypothetical protein
LLSWIPLPTTSVPTSRPKEPSDGVSPALRQQGNMSLRAPHEPAAATVQNGLSIER